MSSAADTLTSSGVRLPLEAIPEALCPYVTEVYEEVIPSFPEPLTLPISAGVTPTLNATLQGRARITLDTGAAFWMPPFLLSGPQPGPYTATCYGAVHGFYVTFKAAGPLALFGTRRFWRGTPGGPPDPVDLVRPDLARRTRAYADALFAVPDFEARAALTVSYLLDALTTAPAAELAAAAFLQRAVDEIERSSGGVRIEALAQALGVSHSTLRRRFAVLGMSAKRFADVVRFRHAHGYLHTTPGATWVDAVHRFGYVDQPHLVRDYRRFSGGPPTRWDPNAHVIDVRLGIEEAHEAGKEG